METKTYIIALFIAALGINSEAKAQTHYEYDTCGLAAYQPFAGEWLYANGQDTIRFYLKVHRDVSTVGDFGKIDVRDEILGWHEYKRGNNIIQSNYANRFMLLPSDRYILPSGSISISLVIDRNYSPCNSTARRLFGFIKDQGLNGELVKVFSAIFSPDLQTLEWSQWRTDFSRNPETAVMTLPCCFTLVRQ